MRLLRILVLLAFSGGLVGCGPKEIKQEGVKTPPPENSGVKGPTGPRPVPPQK